jgi:CheY-like chemotaxis protein
VFADRGQLEQVISNLVINAGDATSDGGTVRVSVDVVERDGSEEGLSEELEPGRYVVLEVSDDGKGMSAEVRERLFEPFFTTKAVGTGTGLGLATSYGIVRSLGGAIAVESEEGVGSTFRVLIPAMDADADAATAMGLRDGSARPSGDERILVVDDEPQVREAAARVLTDHGYQVLQAGNGHEALRILESTTEPFDLVFSDMVMPRMGGGELCERIGQRWPDQRMLLTSGYSVDFLDGVGDGCEAPLVQKPYTIESLLVAVRGALDARRGAATGAGAGS